MLFKGTGVLRICKEMLTLNAKYIAMVIGQWSHYHSLSYKIEIRHYPVTIKKSLVSDVKWYSLFTSLLWCGHWLVQAQCWPGWHWHWPRLSWPEYCLLAWPRLTIARTRPARHLQIANLTTRHRSHVMSYLASNHTIFQTFKYMKRKTFLLDTLLEKYHWS